MARTENSSDSVSFTVTLSMQSASLLEQIAEDGVYGKSRAEVAGRFIDEVLRDYVVPPRFKMFPARKGNMRSPVRVEEFEPQQSVEKTIRRRPAHKR